MTCQKDARIQMKLPRWLVVSLLTVSMLAVLSTGAWWWVTWPERTMQEFISLLKADRIHEADSIMHFGQNTEWRARDFYLRHMASLDFSGMRRADRTIGEILNARAVFLVHDKSYWGFEAQRGIVRLGGDAINRVPDL